MKILWLKGDSLQRKKVLITIFILCIFTLSSFAQSTITGIVKDISGDPLPGVTISVKELPKIGTVTNIDGSSLI